MEYRRSIELEDLAGQAGEEDCLALREGEVLRASVQAVTAEGRVQLGLLGVQTWVRSETPLHVGQELELVVHGRGDRIQLQILNSEDVVRFEKREAYELALDEHSNRTMDPERLRSFHLAIEEDGGLQEEARRRRESGAFAALPLPAAPTGAWTPSRLYFANDEQAEQIVLHLSPGEDGEMRIDLQVGSDSVDLRAEASQLADLECLRAMLPELEEALAERGFVLRTGAIRGGLGSPPPVMDLLPPRADGRSRLDEEA